MCHHTVPVKSHHVCLLFVCLLTLFVKKNIKYHNISVLLRLEHKIRFKEQSGVNKSTVLLFDVAECCLQVQERENLVQ